MSLALSTIQRRRRYIARLPSSFAGSGNAISSALGTTRRCALKGVAAPVVPWLAAREKHHFYRVACCVAPMHLRR
jgi:hypothetical protein